MEEFDSLKLDLVLICMLILLGGFEFTAFQRHFSEKNGMIGHGLIFVSAKGKQQK